jgi:DNA polymerase/3'-5' exonuclease PolX
METSTDRPVADKLREAAQLLEQQGANPFRAGAYRRAADSIDGLERDLKDIMEESGRGALVEIPHIGPGIAAAIDELLHTGGWSQLDSLRVRWIQST